MDSLLREMPIIINSAPSCLQVIHGWSFFIRNYLKLNFDGSSIGNSGLAGIGGTIFMHRDLLWYIQVHWAFEITSMLKPWLFYLA